MKRQLIEVCKEIGPCIAEILVFTGMYYYFSHTTQIGSRPGMNVIVPAVCVCIIIGNVILNMKSEVLIEYLGKWAMVSFVFSFILVGAVLYGGVPDASMRLIFVISTTFGLVVTGYSKIIKMIFGKDTKEDAANEDK